MDKVHFGHVCFGAATMSGMATLAVMLGHLDGTGMFHVIGTAIGMLIFSVMYANFK